MPNKKQFILIATCLIILFLTACSMQKAKTLPTQAEPPVLADNTILRPRFELQNKTFSTGTAFAIKLEEEKVSLVLTAYHLFGKDGGLDEKIPASELPNVLKKVTFKDAYNENQCGQCEKVLKIKDADTNPNINKDLVAVYYDEKLNANCLKLSSLLPKSGEAVWLASPTMLSLEPKLHKATVKLASDKMLYFEYEEKDIMLQATSGAPIINSAGEVVGLNIGGGEQGGKTIGIANPCTSMKKMIKQALSEKES